MQIESLISVCDHQAVRNHYALGADIDTIITEGRTALMVAASSGCSRTLKSVLIFNPKVDVLCFNRMHALDYAANKEIKGELIVHMNAIKNLSIYTSSELIQETFLSMDSSNESRKLL